MKTKTKLTSTAIAMTAFAIVGSLMLGGCEQFLAMFDPTDTGTDTGTLVLTIDEPSARTIEPTLDMEIATYTISGTGPGNASFTEGGITDTAYVRTDLEEGSWTITVTGYNADATPVAVGEGSATTTIVGGQTSTADVTVSPYEGSGTLTLAITWPAGELTSPSVEATLTPQGGTGGAITVPVSGDSASYSGTHGVGYYLLSLKLKDGTTEVWGMVDVVRIVKDETASATIDLTLDEINPVTVGDVQVNITQAMDNSVAVSLTGAPTTLSTGTDMTVTANPTPATGATFQWYLGGDELTGETASAITIGASLAEGNYRLDCVVSVGDAMGAGGVGFAVASEQVVYSEDFSDAPLITPTSGIQAGDALTWNSASGTYEVYLRETSSGYRKFAETPEFDIPDDTSFQIEFDVNFVHGSFGMGMIILAYSSVDDDPFQPPVRVGFHDGVTGNGFYVQDSTGSSGQLFETSTNVKNTWLRFRVSYDSASATADLLVTRLDTAEELANVQEAPVAVAGFRRLGFGAFTNYGDGTDAEMHFDNVRVIRR